MSWRKIWDNALDNGVKGTRCVQTISRELSRPMFSDKLCHLCDKEIVCFSVYLCDINIHHSCAINHLLELLHTMFFIITLGVVLSHKSLYLLLSFFIWHLNFHMYTVCIATPPCGSIAVMNFWAFEYPSPDSIAKVFLVSWAFMKSLLALGPWRLCTELFRQLFLAVERQSKGSILKSS